MHARVCTRPSTPVPTRMQARAHVQRNMIRERSSFLRYTYTACLILTLLASMFISCRWVSSIKSPTDCYEATDSGYMTVRSRK
jgi:hypothetical protein